MKINKLEKKKAILLPETLKIIIGVFCIVLLVYLAVQLYGIFTKYNDIQKATAHMKALEGKIESIKDGGEFNYLLYNPPNWVLTGWPYGEDNKYNVPYCVDQGWNKCLCLCDMDLTVAEFVKLTNSRPDQISQKCQLNKLCFEVKAKNLKVNPIVIGVNLGFWKYEYFLGDLTPIFIGQLVQKNKGSLDIKYDKAKDELSIVPSEVK